MAVGTTAQGGAVRKKLTRDDLLKTTTGRRPTGLSLVVARFS